MGKGIGSIIDWVFIIKKNNIFIELIGKYRYVIFKSLKNCKKKILFLIKIIFDNYIKKWKNFKYFI